VLSSTNLIENLFSRVCELAWRVRHRQGGAMILQMDRGRRAGSRAQLPARLPSAIMAKIAENASTPTRPGPLVRIYLLPLVFRLRGRFNPRLPPVGSH
jgi:hypothetical protein